MNDILKHRQAVNANIQRLFGEGIDCNGEFQKAQDAEIEKARHGIYADTAENRRLNRVGQEYGHKAQEQEPSGKQPKGSGEDAGGKDYSSHAKGASDEALKRAAADEKADKGVRDAAKKELEKRGKSGGGDDGNGGDGKSSTYETASPEEKKRFDAILKESYKYEGKDGLFDEFVWEIDPEDGDLEKFGVDIDNDKAVDKLIREKISPDRLNQIYKKWCSRTGNKDIAEKDKAMKNSRLGKGNEKIKDDWMKRIQESGYGREDEDLMIKNQKYFQDVLDKHGIEDVREFFNEDQMQEGKSFEDYEKIFDECFEKIPAKEFKR